MKPDENDVRPNSMFKAARALAAQTRAAEAKDMLAHNHHGGSAHASSAHASPAPSASSGSSNPTFVAINAQLAGRSFLGGLQPSAADRAAYELVIKTLGTAPAATALSAYPALQGWFGLVGLFAESVRSSWTA
jgi:glutathione S-transferase